MENKQKLIEVQDLCKSFHKLEVLKHISTAFYKNEVVSVIGIADLMFRTNDVIAATYKTLESLAVAAVIYFVMTFLSSRLISLAERKLSHGK